MADQDRWTSERNRGRWASDDRTRRGYEDYGQRSEYGRQDEGRSFRAGDESEIYGAGYGGGYSQDDYGSRYGSSGQYRGGRDSYGQGRRGGHRASWAQGSYGQGPSSYNQSEYPQGAQGGYGGYGDQGSYGQGAGGGYDSGSQYRGSSYDPRRHDQGSYGSYGSSTGRYGGALGYGPNDTAPRYADRDWNPRHPEGDDHRSWMERTGDKIANFFGADGHRGRGPKNYTRSDERIREDVNDRLTEDPILDASDIDVTVSSGEVTLTGTVGSRDEKRRAEDMAEQVSGARHVQNNLRVQQQSYGSASYGSTGYGASSTTGSTTTGASTTGASTTATSTDAAGKGGTSRTN